MSPIRFVAGQNAPLAATPLTFTVSSATAADVSALVVDYELRALSSDDFVFYNHPATQGMQLASNAITIDLEAVHPAARAVLCIASVDPAGPDSVFARFVARLRQPDGRELTTEIDCRAGESAVICWELYRRAGEWKVRAVGQGYAGGLAVLLARHGLEVKDAAVSAPLQATGMERLGMILEDGARSAYSFVSSTGYAASRLDDELSAAVADPSMRTGPQADAARTLAQQRHDELVGQAKDRFDQDSDQLIAELHEVERTLPRALADWTSTAWTDLATAPEPVDAIRIGSVVAPERGPLRIPLCLPLPFRRGLWITGPDSPAVADVVLSLVLRTLAANSTTTLDIIDRTGSLAALTTGAAVASRGSIATEPDSATAYLDSLPGQLELEMLRRAEGVDDAPARLIVLNHFPFGYESRHLALIARMVESGAALRVSIVLVGEEPSVDDFAVYSLAQRCQLLPAGGGRWADPWTSTAWSFETDAIPADPVRRSCILDHFTGGAS